MVFTVFFLNAHYETEAHRKVGLGSCVLVDRNIYPYNVVPVIYNTVIIMIYL